MRTVQKLVVGYASHWPRKVFGLLPSAGMANTPGARLRVTAELHRFKVINGV